jgi:hypothetical protein
MYLSTGYITLDIFQNAISHDQVLSDFAPIQTQAGKSGNSVQEALALRIARGYRFILQPVVR